MENPPPKRLDSSDPLVKRRLELTHDPQWGTTLIAIFPAGGFPPHCIEVKTQELIKALTTEIET